MPEPNELVLTLENLSSLGLTNADVEILQESEDAQGQEINNGVMRIRVPFYVSGSSSRAQGFKKKIVWSDNALNTMLQEGNAQITGGKQPLTVYPRHAHALSGRDLPCGDIVLLERDGRLGKATIEVAPTSVGKDVQILARAKKLNAVSLRSTKGGYVLADATLEGEPVLLCERITLAGVDFAPDGPSQETFGIEILNENVQAVLEEPVEKEDPKPKQEGNPMGDTPLTLESLRSDYSALVVEIEKPLNEKLAKALDDNKVLTQEIATLRGEKAASELDSFIADIAQRSSDPKLFAQTFRELCQENKITDVAGATPYVVPLLLNVIDAAKTTPVVPAKDKKTMLQDLFPTKEGSGTSDAGEDKDKEVVLTQEQREDRNSRTVVGGLVLPDEGGLL